MASKPRKQSESGFYHVFHRGVNLYDIFEDDDDRKFYLRRLLLYAREMQIEIHAWCLMSNHYHLLVRANHQSLSALMRKIGSVYARHFNRRHHRTGPLFEGRFCSVCVESDAQFLAVIRYIHRNPLHHEERTLIGDYPWSSYREYVAASPETCTIAFGLSLFGSVEEAIRYHDAICDHERHLDIETIGLLSDDEARLRADSALGNSGFAIAVSHLGKLSRVDRDRAIRYVRRLVGCSLRQIQRLTGIAYSAIRKAIRSGRNDAAQGEDRWLRIAFAE